MYQKLLLEHQKLTTDHKKLKTGIKDHMNELLKSVKDVEGEFLLLHPKFRTDHFL